MCGRYVVTASVGELARRFGAADETAGALGVSYNVAPTMAVPAVLVAPDRPGSRGARCGCCAGGWCRRGRPTRRSAPA